ncbi:phage baseplate assembly protein W [Paenibacillus sp. W4I10]|uniref:GPW/gp25 family protein n=1 Tax=Paenibacillus sp. W4I10 TaxID=3042298 RepID=UPI002785F024|nr:GPW/gp25 family protein [Paenibacillus sp. W4I10]MDQ0719817.1 phage baseplate assembly protein W [Paenibacillus sp. W4I10]
MIEHVLNDADTIQGLSVLYNVPWQDIADYNGLEYPYTMTSREAYYTLYANGYLLVRRQSATRPLTFYAGSLFMTDVDSQGVQKVYELVEDTTLAAGVAEGYFYVRSRLPGSFGNTIANSVVLSGSVRSNSDPGSLSITNPEPFNNGKDARVRLTGQTIYINSDQAVTTTLEPLGGTDLMVSSDGDLMEDETGDWAAVAGIDNIKQAVSHRLVTRRGSLTQHPTYGSRLHEFIGLAQAPYIRQLVELDIHETLNYEDRIDAVTVDNVVIQQAAYYVYLTIDVSGRQEIIGLQVDQSGVAIAA